MVDRERPGTAKNLCKHAVPSENFQSENGTTFSAVPFFPEIFQWNEPKNQVPLNAGHRSRSQVTGHRAQVTGHQAQVTDNAIKKLDFQLSFSCLFICFISGYVTIRHMFGIDHASRCSESKGTKALFTSTLVLGLP